MIVFETKKYINTCDDELQIYYNAAIMAEYQKVLSCEHLKFSMNKYVS